MHPLIQILNLFAIIMLAFLFTDLLSSITEYAYTMRVTMAGNVYSFGVILLELLTGKPPVSEGTELARWVLNNTAQRDKWDRILDFSISRTSLAVRNQMLAVLKVALGCVSVVPEARPKMKSVLRMLLNAR